MRSGATTAAGRAFRDGAATFSRRRGRPPSTSSPRSSGWTAVSGRSRDSPPERDRDARSSPRPTRSPPRTSRPVARLGAHGAELLAADSLVLTHCNAGALATAGYGTALGVIRGAVEAGKVVRVLACETRPFLQGARLTAWELARDGIPVEVITDSMGGHFLSRGEVARRRRRSRPDRRQRRHRQQDRHVFARRPREGERRARSTSPRPRRTIDLACPDGSAHPDRGAQLRRGPARSPASRSRPAGVRARYRRLRRHAGALHHGHRDGAGNLPAAVSRASRAPSRRLRAAQFVRRRLRRCGYGPLSGSALATFSDLAIMAS